MNDIMKQGKVIFLTKLPPPNTGQTIGSLLTFNMVSSERDVELINLSFSKFKPSKPGLNLLWYNISYSCFFFLKAMKLIGLLIRTKPGYFYLVPGASLFGYYRDLLIIALVRLLSRRTRIVVHIRAGDFKELFRRKATRSFSKWYESQIHTFIFLSKSLSQEMSGFVKPEKHFVLHNPIDEAVRLGEEEFLDKMKTVEQKELRIVFISNMIPSKGYFELVKACHLVKNEVSFTLDLIGHWVENGLESKVRAYLDSNELNDVIRIRGAIRDREKIKKELLKANVFALPTYYPTEAQPRSIIEAMNAGCAILATRHASIPDYVVDGEMGYLVEKKNIEELAEGLKKLANPEELREKMIASREAYKRGFDPDDLKKRLLTVFE